MYFMILFFCVKRYIQKLFNGESLTLSLCVYNIWIVLSIYVSWNLSSNDNNEVLYEYILYLFIYSDSKYSLNACSVPVLS